MPCSGFTLHTTDGSHLMARTLDFDQNPGAKLMVIPRKWPVCPTGAGNGADSGAYNAKYAQIAMGVVADGVPLTLDGINECGLAGAMFYYPGHAHYGGSAGGKMRLDPSMAVKYTLAMCGNLDEAAQLFGEKISFTSGTPEGSAPPLHFLFSDCSGEAMVVEPDEGGVHIYRNTVGVLTNSPGYPWHETNLRNYLGVSREPRSPLEMEGRVLPQISSNAALWGLPGDYSSVSRFVKTAYLKHFIEQPRSESAGVTAAFHILSAVSVPRFCVGANEAEAGYTMYTAVLSTSSKTYYFHTYDNRRIQAVSLDNENPDAAEIKYYEWNNTQDIDRRN